MSEQMTSQQMVAQAARKMVEVRKRVGYIEKKGRNEGQGYNFAQAADFYDKARQAMDDVGITTVVASELKHVETYEAVNKKGVTQTWQRVIVLLTMTFIDADTGCIAGHGSALGCGADNGDKAIPKANTGAAKYVLATTFLVSTGDDPEASREVDDAVAPSKAPAVVAGTTDAATTGPAAAPAAAPPKGPRTKSGKTLAALLERLAAIPAEDAAAFEAFRLAGTAERDNMTKEDWLKLKDAVTSRIPQPTEKN